MYSLEEVNTKLAELQTRFNEAQTKKTAAKEDVDTYDAELYRLQGEFRVLNQMKEVLSQAEVAKADPALVVEAKPKKEGKE
jgi:hypothetical protein